jgi:hypothetical protein
MSSKKRKVGWDGLVELHEAEPEPAPTAEDTDEVEVPDGETAKTILNLQSPFFGAGTIDFAGGQTQPDFKPQVASAPSPAPAPALASRKGASPAAPNSAPAGNGTPRGRSLEPRPLDARPGEAARPTSGPLRLPVPGEAGRRSLPPGPALLPEAGGTPARGNVAPPPAMFSGEDLMEKLGAGAGASAGAERPKKKSGSIWSEYRELILTALVGSLVLAAVLGYRAYNKDVSGEVIATDPTAGTGPSGPPGGAPTPPTGPTGPLAPTAPTSARIVPIPGPTGGPAPTGAPPPGMVVRPPTGGPTGPTAPSGAHAPKPKAAVPMLSIMSTPLGAVVEVDGVVAGKTPLVIPTPFKDPRTLRIRLNLEGYRRWEQDVSPSEAGHYVANARLEPRSR